MARRKSKDSLITQLGHLVVYAVFLSIELVLRILPLRACHAMGTLGGWLAFHFLPGYRKLALNNLRIAFGREQDDAWLKETTRKHFLSLGGNFVSGLKLPLMSPEAVAKRVTTEGIEHVQAAAQSGKSVLGLVCHLSCWEVLTQVPTLFTQGLAPASIYQPLGNPYLNALVKRRREKLGYVLFDRSQGFGGPMKHLREQPGILGVLVDQHAGDKGIWCPFFDRLASTTSLPALMSIRSQAPIIPFGIYDDGPARWRLVVYPPLNSHEAKPTPEGITAMMNIAVEVMVRRAPHNWFWVHNRWKTPNPDFLLSQYRRGVVYAQGYDQSRLQPFNLLVRSPNWLGDACMAFPAVRALKKSRPDLRLTIFCPDKLADLWRSLPEIDAIITKQGKESTGTVAKRIKSAGAFDAAILLTNSTRSTLELWRAGIPRIVGYPGSFRSRLLHQTISEPKPSGPPEHHAARYMRIATRCGAAPEDITAPPLPQEAIGSYRLGICAGAEYGPAKRWPLESFAETAQQLSQRWPQAEWLLLGAPGEKELGEKLSGLLRGVRHHNLVGRTTLSELIATIKQCRLIVTNDTGTMHMAAALGVPTVSIFGSTEPVLTGPVGDTHQIVRHHVACSPCFKRECPYGHYDCMKGVTPERVERAVLKALTA